MNSPVVLGLDFGGTKIAAGVCEMSGVRLGTTTVDTRPTDGAEACLERGIRAARDLLDTLAPGRPLAAVGIPLAARVPRGDSVSGMALGRRSSHGAADVFARAGEDPAMARLLAEFVAELSFHLVNLAIAIDPRRIVVGGGMVRSWDQLRDGLRRALDAAVPYPPELVPAEFPFDAPLLGALALGIAAARQLYPMHETAPVTPA